MRGLQCGFYLLDSVRSPIVRNPVCLTSVVPRWRGICWRGLQDRELLAGAAFVLAGYSSGRGVGARISGSGVLRFYRRVLRLSHACCLPPSAKQDGLRNAPFLFRRGSGSPVVRSQAPYGYRTYLVYFGIVRFLAAIPTGHGERSRRRGVNTFLRKHINLAMLSAGRTLGAARPQTCAKEPLALWTLFIGFAAEYVLAKHGNTCCL